MKILGLLNGQNAITGVIACSVSIFTLFVGLKDREVNIVKEEVQKITSLEERLSSQQRQLNSVEGRQESALEVIRKKQEKLRQDALFEGSGQNRLLLKNIEKRLDTLQNKVENLPATAGGGVDQTALKRTIDQARKQIIQELDFKLASTPVANGSGLNAAKLDQAIRQSETRIMASVAATVAPIIDEKIAALPNVSGDGIPIATKRRIHFVEKDCVHLQSMPKQFTAKFKRGAEFCWKPSVLWFDISTLQSNGLEVRYSGDDKRWCNIGKVCYVGSKEDGTRFKVRIENTYEKDGIRFSEVNFEKID